MCTYISMKFRSMNWLPEKNEVLRNQVNLRKFGWDISLIFGFVLRNEDDHIPCFMAFFYIAEGIGNFF